MTTQETPAQPAAATSPLPPPHMRGALVLLFAVYALNFLDRQIVNILAEPIRRELRLADWQLGLMSGSAFALFYAIAGIPIARFAEVRSRPAIISVATAIWSAFTVLCGFSASFLQLLFFRFGVGIGEAGGVPPAHSLISDYVPRERRAAALAFFHMGLPIGALLGLAIGGVVADLHGWRAAFITAGLPGLFIAAAIFAWLPEPRRQFGSTSDGTHTTLAETLRHLLAKPTFRLFLMGATLISFVTYAHQAFIAPFLFRAHEMELGQLAERLGLGPTALLGVALGLMVGCAGAFGMWLGGQLADRGARKNAQSYSRVTALSLILFVPVQIMAFVAHGIDNVFTSLALAILLSSMWVGPVQATIQSVAPPHMRATASAILLLSINLLGLGLGPLLLGLLSDWLTGFTGLESAESLRWAMIAMTSPALLAAASFWMAGRTIADDIEA